VLRDPWDGGPVADRNQLDAEEDRRLRNLFDEPDIWPEDDRDHQYRVAHERAKVIGIATEHSIQDPFTDEISVEIELGNPQRGEQ
jgi:hypothetical protein